MTPPDALERLRLARSEGVGPIAYRRLVRRYGSAGAALDVLPRLARAGGRMAPPRVPSARAVAREIEAVAARGARHLFLDTEDYPPLLALLEDAPPVLAFAGDPALFARPAVAIVGARNASLNGRRLAAELAEALAGAGYVVVSGLARGIDAAAHEGALRAGATFAAIAGGLDRPYPPENAALQARISAAGGVFAEAPLGTAPQARHFPRRNRIIAGLALGCVVVEAALRSGSLITARLAIEAGREIFAAPGSPRDPRSQGSNHLIRQGAHLTETLADILDHLPPSPGTGRAGGWRQPAAIAAFAATRDADPAPAAEDRGHAAILALLGPAPIAVDDILRYCQLSPAVVMAALLELEIAGRVETLPGNRVALIAGPAEP
ncbi:DNA-processing protein DprA [Acidiphilium sp.]|uniref:DNA-processing protein DprA n=1 Tax=Acidiphilium sp. TaxID=527 RepID=UPI002590E542|nr:DNA-processing protein DprA [Acidiphilium sp.]